MPEAVCVSAMWWTSTSTELNTSRSSLSKALASRPSTFPQGRLCSFAQ